MPNECTFKPKTKRGPKPTDELFSETASLASDYLKLISDKTQHRTEALYNFYKLEQEKKEKNMRTVDDIDIEKNMSECTFTPCLEKRREYKNSSNLDQKNSLKIEKPQNSKNFNKNRNNNDPKEKKIVSEHFDTSQSYITDSMRELFRLDTLKSYKQDPEDIFSDF